MRSAMRRASLASCVEPMLAALHHASHADGAPRAPCDVGDSHGDVLAVVDGAQTAYDVANVHLGCSRRKAAADPIGGASAAKEREKTNKYLRRERALEDFVLLDEAASRRPTGGWGVNSRA